jgi:transcriptional regulator with GAF, ATPase, and Fis domain
MTTPAASRIPALLWSASLRCETLQEFLGHALRTISQVVPLERLEIRGLAEDARVISTIARAPIPASGRALGESDVVALRPDGADSLVRRLRAAASLLLGEHRRTAVFEAIDPRPDSHRRLALPLHRGARCLGVALLESRSQWRRESQAAIERLGEPIAAALQHHLDRSELHTLKSAADAEREALLRRLGREDGSTGIVGIDSGLRLVMERVDLIARTDLPTLILGETGSGKEVVARAIHDRSSRARAPFVRVNCGAVPPELVDSELFGHDAGSFTGATRTRRGWFERADGGTLFLDEVGELPASVQVRLLRVLQEGTFERVGGEESVHVSVRVLSATHCDLASMVQHRVFREDLWYRLAVFQIPLPPLRERLDDIPELARHFAARAARRFGLPPVNMVESDVALLRSYDWPGNVRELASVIDRAVILGRGASIELGAAFGQAGPLLRAPSGAPLASQPPMGTRVGATRGHELQRQTGPAHRIAVDEHPRFEAGLSRSAALDLDANSLNRVLRTHIERVLSAVHGRIEGPHGAAVRLGVNPHTLRARMRRLKIDWAAFRSPQRTPLASRGEDAGRGAADHIAARSTRHSGGPPEADRR